MVTSWLGFREELRAIKCHVAARIGHGIPEYSYVRFKLRFQCLAIWLGIYLIQLSLPYIGRVFPLHAKQKLELEVIVGPRAA